MQMFKIERKELADLNNITASVYIGPFFMISLFDGSLRWESGLQPTLSKESMYRVRLWNIRKWKTNNSNENIPKWL